MIKTKRDAIDSRSVEIRKRYQILLVEEELTQKLFLNRLVKEFLISTSEIKTALQPILNKEKSRTKNVLIGFSGTMLLAYPNTRATQLRPSKSWHTDMVFR